VLATSLNTITRWHSFWDPRVLMNPLRPFVQWYHGNIIQKYIRKELEQRFAELKAERLESGTSEPKTKRVKSVIALALESYISETPDTTSILQAPRLDNTFATSVSHQIRLFLFAGNDTTASTITYVFHMLSKYPSTRALLREEHDTIFGPDISATGDRLKEHPALLNQCRYTAAFIKETLRICPPASSMRQGVPGSTITTADGKVLPTEDLYIITNTWAVHTNPRVWVRPMEFLPERWLVPAGHELYPPTGAYRPFDLGARACIGQGLSLSELRVVLVMTARRFVVTEAYKEWDAMQEAKRGVWGRVKKWVGGEEINTVNGERAYQTDYAGTHPSDGYPCRVELAE
jgi:cytochrome P450